MAAEDSRLGRVLDDRYRIDEQIGRGGMSSVFRGLDTQLQRPVAIKVFQHGEDGDDLRWESEIRLLSQLNHPHLVTLHDAHLEPRGGDGASYLIMELVLGSDLQHLLARRGPSAALAALVITQIGEALGSVHARDIIHRDLKPGNILMESTELPPLFLRAKLADFGIAHLLGSDRVTRTGTMIGTAAYTSPEQVNGQAATPASDVYSLGLVALECLSGRPAFPGTPTESLIARLTGDPVLPANITPEWAALLASMTARDPALRPSALEAALLARECPEELPPVVPGSADAERGDHPTERMLPPTVLMPASAAPRPGAGDAPTAVLAGASRTPPAVRPRPRRPWIIAIVIVATLLVAAGAVLSRLPSGAAAPSGSTSTTPVPTATSTPTLASTSTSPAATPPAAPPAPGNGHGPGPGRKKKG